jgi:ribonuclease HII
LVEHVATGLFSGHPEWRWWQHGAIVAGVDEAGRGALAGPVVAAAVVLDPQRIPKGIADSKTLSKGARESLAPYIQTGAIAVGIGIVDNQWIDEINILQATFKAMHFALDELGVPNLAHIMVDGNRFLSWQVPHTCIVDGDALSVSIGAASIIAKTTRDAIMRGEMHTQFPLYGFHRHVGYATVAHRAAILEHGQCAIHRSTFLRKLLA